MSPAIRYSPPRVALLTELEESFLDNADEAVENFGTSSDEAARAARRARDSVCGARRSVVELRVWRDNRGNRRQAAPLRDGAQGAKRRLFRHALKTRVKLQKGSTAPGLCD